MKFALAAFALLFVSASSFASVQSKLPCNASAADINAVLPTSIAAHSCIISTAFSTKQDNCEKDGSYTDNSDGSDHYLCYKYKTVTGNWDLTLTCAGAVTASLRITCVQNHKSEYDFDKKVVDNDQVISIILDAMSAQGFKLSNQALKQDRDTSWYPKLFFQK